MKNLHKLKKNIYITFLIFLFLSLIIQCNKNFQDNNYRTSLSEDALLEEPLVNNTPFNQDELDRLELLDNDHTYPIDSAKKWAEAIAKEFDKQDMEKGVFTHPRKVKNAFVVNTQQKSIALRNSISASSRELLISDTTPEYYIFNYENNRGYAVIGADERALGTYTSSDAGAIDSSLKNQGLVTMLSECINFVYDKRGEELELLRDSIYYSLVKKINSMEKANENTNNTTLSGPSDLDKDKEFDDRYPRNRIVSSRVRSVEEVEYQEQYGPFLKTTWDQDYPYNKFYDYGDCGFTGQGRRYSTGCVPLSYAQIFAYYRGKNNHGGRGEWTKIASKPKPTTTREIDLVAALVKGLYNESYIKWQSCDGSPVISLTHPGNMIIKPKYNFANGDWRDYSSHHITISLQQSKPLIISGYPEHCILFFGCMPNYFKGHQWVLDGYRRKVRKVTKEVEIKYASGTSIIRRDTYHSVISNTDWHHNWGWGYAVTDASNWSIAGVNQKGSGKSNYGSDVKIIAYITWKN